MADDDSTGDTTPRQGEPQRQAGAVMSPPPPPPPVTGTGTEPPRGPDGRRRGGLVGGLVLVTIGLILLAQQFFPNIGLERFWPLILIVIGLGIIFRRR